MSPEIVVVVVVGLLVAAALVVIVRGGRFTGRARLGGAEVEIGSHRHSVPQAGEATIKRSKAGGDATAIGSIRATIDQTEAGGNLSACAGEPPGPNG